MMTMIPILDTGLGKLYQGDCLDMMRGLEQASVDLAFADPPFNLGKKYPSNINDALASHEYLNWSRTWLDEMVRVLKPGGALFLWNLPKWNLPLGAYLNDKLTFRHWIAVDIKCGIRSNNKPPPSSGEWFSRHDCEFNCGRNLSNRESIRITLPI